MGIVNTNMSFVGNSFNIFTNLDSAVTRVINYIRDTKTPDAERIWKLLKYSTIKALYEDNLTPEEKNALIYKNDSQDGKRVFCFPFVEDEFLETCSLIRVYIDSIEPVNHLISTLNIGFDILTHNKLSVVYNDCCDVEEGGRVIEQDISVKSRNDVLLKSLLAILNGASIAGVGQLQFNHSLSDKDMAEQKMTNRRNFYGYKFVMSCQFSTLGGAVNANKA